MILKWLLFWNEYTNLHADGEDAGQDTKGMKLKLPRTTSNLEFQFINWHQTRNYSCRQTSNQFKSFNEEVPFDHNDVWCILKIK